MKLFNEGEHLTEEKLGQMLESIAGKENVQRQYKVGKYKVDFLVWGNLVVEFDGFRHYNSSKVIDRDVEVARLCETLGLVIMHVPYFIQWPYVCEALGRTEDDFGYAYPNGFISKTALTPKDFNLQGLFMFIAQLKTFTAQVQEEILATMGDNDWECYNTTLELFKETQN